MRDLTGTYLGMALQMAKNSHAVRKKIGAIIVTESGVILPGYNGTPTGRDNVCETEQNVTKQEVLHAELNAILKAAREGVSIKGATLYLTLSPCLPCAAMLEQVGIKKVIYLEDYRLPDGVEFLQNSKTVIIERFKDEN